MKYDIAKNNDGPLSRTMKATAASKVNRPEGEEEEVSKYKKVVMFK